MYKARIILIVGLAKGVSAEPSSRPKAPTSADIVAAAPPGAWRPLALDRTLVMELPAGRVVIELAPAFAPAHAGNIVTLAREHFWDGLAVLRVQDNYVAQWGDPNVDADATQQGGAAPRPRSLGSAKAKVPAEISRPLRGVGLVRHRDRDVYAGSVGWVDGFPVAHDGKQAWLVHCYGMVGAGRGDAIDSSTGAELYAVIGHAPRHLDRNITLVGRVVAGIEVLSALPRGPAPMGFYDKAKDYTPITRVRLASELPVNERPALEIMRTESRAFAAFVRARQARRESWFHVPAGHADLCNIGVPVRTVATANVGSANGAPLR